MTDFLKTLKGLRTGIESLITTTEWQTLPPYDKMTRWLEIKGSIVEALHRVGKLEREIIDAKNSGKRY